MKSLYFRLQDEKLSKVFVIKGSRECYPLNEFLVKRGYACFHLSELFMSGFHENISCFYYAKRAQKIFHLTL